MLWQAGVVSYDVFFQGFAGGEIVDGGSVEMLRVLAPHTTNRSGTFIHIQVGDGEADLYLDSDGMMANHVTGTDPWELLVRGAEAANWVILPIDGPTCLTGPGQREELPEGLDDHVIFVETGADLLSAIIEH